MKYPATHIVHWPSGPVACCKEHADQLVGLSNFIGGRVLVTKILDGPEQCGNCVNEASIRELNSKESQPKE